VLVAPCGSGKTFAVLNAWLRKRPTRHLIYVLPTQTLLRGVERTISRHISNDLAGFRLIRLEEKRFLDDTSVTMAADYGQHRETYLYGHDIVLTTLDSYLARLYRGGLTRQRYRDLPIGRVLNSTTVFDEAHMYDNYTHTLLKYTLQLLQLGQAHHVLMTATLNEKLAKYLGISDQSYLWIEVPRQPEADENWDSFTGDQNLAPVTSCSSQDFSLTIKGIIDHEGMSQVLVVCNTVKRAQEAYMALKHDNPNTMLIHSRYTPEDRDKREEQIYDLLGRDEYCIVSTQVVEAGLDISVPNLITEMPRGDSFVQRKGRCARRRGQTGRVYPIRVDEEKPYPYEKNDIDSLASLLNTTQVGPVLSGMIEKQIVELVSPPSLSNEKEAKARSLILNAFLSVAAFGERVYTLPTRDATPIHFYVGQKPLSSGPVDDPEKIVRESVRIDLRLLHTLSHNPDRDFDAYTVEYDPEANDGKGQIRLSQGALWAWSIVQPKSAPKPKLLKEWSYDAEEGLRIG